MSRRTLMAALLLAVVGCQPQEETKTTDEGAAQAKTPAQLIVGTWKRVKQKSQTANPLNQRTLEFAADGTCTDRSHDPKNGFQVTNGTYIVVGNEMTITLDPDFPDRKVLIEEINNDKLTISDNWNGNLMVEYYERVSGAIASRDTNK